MERPTGWLTLQCLTAQHRRLTMTIILMAVGILTAVGFPIAA